MFLNYFDNDRLASPINIATARIIISGYLIWKLASYNFTAVVSSLPVFTQRYGFARHPLLLEFIEFEVVFTIVLLVLFAIGYREGVTGFLSCVLVSHLAMVRFGWNWSGGTTADFIAVYFIALFALYREYDILSVDSLYRAGRSLRDYNQLLQDDTETDSYPAPMLKWSLVVIALIYFGSAFGKAVKGPVWEWVQPQNLMRHTQRMGAFGGDLPLNEFLASSPIVAVLSSVGTFVLEGGFLISVLAGGPVWLFALGLFGMVVIVAVSMGPFFFDVYFFLGALANWQRLFKNPDSEIQVVYDEHCLFCVKSLAPFRLLDVSQTIVFDSQYTVPIEYDNPEHDFEKAMYVFAEGNVYRGYHAFRRLLRHYPALVPVSALMSVGPVAAVGKRVYGYIAANRGRHFTCSVEDTDGQTKRE